MGRLLLGVPADRRRIEQHVGALQRSEACAFGIPLVPAHERPDPSHARVERTEAQVAGREIELLVVGRIVGDVHLAVGPHHAPVGVDHRGAVVVETRGAALEHGRDHDDARVLRRLPQRLRARPRDGLGQIEQVGILALGEVLRPEQLREADELRAGRRRLRHLRECSPQVRVRFGGHRHLDQADLELRRGLRCGHGLLDLEFGGDVVVADAADAGTRDIATGLRRGRLG